MERHATDRRLRLLAWLAVVVALHALPLLTLRLWEVRPTSPPPVPVRIAATPLAEPPVAPAPAPHWLDDWMRSVDGVPVTPAPRPPLIAFSRQDCLQCHKAIAGLAVPTPTCPWPGAKPSDR